MKLIDRHERCIGIRLFKSKKHFIQLWYCPANYEVQPHSHGDQHIELMYLFGKTTFFREKKTLLPTTECFTPKWYHFGTRFTVNPKQVHSFTVSSLPLIFINFATFIDGKTPTSAAIDFHPTYAPREH